MQEIDEIPIEFDHDDVFKSEKKMCRYIYSYIKKNDQLHERQTNTHTHKTTES